VCNAWNHPPDCTCGWGGEGHLGRSSGSSRFPVSGPQTVLQSQFRLAASFTNPNANCPVCGARVYFYQSPAGGRVFFDDLGPPWPKHPCTDNSMSVGSLARPAVAPLAAVSRPDAKRPQWLDDGWLPFICDDAQASTGDVGYCMLVGRLGDTLTILYLCTVKLPDEALLQVKPARPNEFDVSMAWIESGTNRVRSILLKAFTNAYLAGEWCAKEAKTGKPRMSRLVQAVVVKGNTVQPQLASSGRASKGGGKPRREHGCRLKKEDGTQSPSLHSKSAGTTQKLSAVDVKKAEDSQDKLGPRKPRTATGNAMALAFANARAKKAG
jgi:hypothetical protein